MSLFTVMVLFVFVHYCKRSAGLARWKLFTPLVMYFVEMGQTMLYVGSDITMPEFYMLIITQESYAVARNLGIMNKIFNKTVDTLGPLIGAPTTDEVAEARRHRQLDKLSVIAPSSNIMVLLGPVFIMAALCAEQVYESITPSSMKAGSYYSGGLLAGWRGTVSPAETALMLVVLMAIRIVFFKMELTLADRVIDAHEERDHHAEAKQLVNMYFGEDRAAIYVVLVLAVIVTICNLTEIMKFARIIYLADM